jgi:hypothetical protein
MSWWNDQSALIDQIHAWKYSPDQPREPAGSPEGGEFASSPGAAEHRWEIKGNMILHNGKVQDEARYLWTLKPSESGQDLDAERRLLFDRLRMPVFRRLSSPQDEYALIAARRDLPMSKTVPLIKSEQAVEIPKEHRQEISNWLRKTGEHDVANFLGL